MSIKRDERLAILEQWRGALCRYNEAMDRVKDHPPWSAAEVELLEEADTHLQMAEHAEKRYFDGLPRMAMSCCPFDGEPLVRSFDPFGLDGPWWRTDATPEEPPACEHFCVLLGAVSYDGRNRIGGDFEAHPGPEVPYVVPRLLEQAGMVAVIWQMPMHNGYFAYPIAYFAERRPPAEALAAGWARTNYVYTTESGQSRWRGADDPWDFELAPWIRRGKIRWCPPGTEAPVLNQDPAQPCPYVDLPGDRQRVIVRGDRARLAGVPGRMISFEVPW